MTRTPARLGNQRNHNQNQHVQWPQVPPMPAMGQAQGQHGSLMQQPMMQNQPGMQTISNTIRTHGSPRNMGKTSVKTHISNTMQT